MKAISPLKYLLVLSLPILGAIAMCTQGLTTYLPLIEAFVLIPFLELFVKPNPKNLSEKEEQAFLKNPLFDVMLYLIVPVQFTLLLFFLFTIGDTSISITSRLGRLFAMGIACGVLGINVAHELGHRRKKFERYLGKSLLLTSLYMHFYIEHNRGHHKYFCTQRDPATARLGEAIYVFWFRSIYQTYLSAWRLEKDRLKKVGKSIFSLSNEMIIYHLVQAVFLLVITLIFGPFVLGQFLIAAAIGILLLESVNYIEHYGLMRNLNSNGHYERALPEHSWNSDHMLGRLMLFELSRHSDHHYITTKKYQVLAHHDDSPQLPTGYPGMILFALLPMFWIPYMNRRIEKFKQHKK